LVNGAHHLGQRPRIRIALVGDRPERFGRIRRRVRPTVLEAVRRVLGVVVVFVEEAVALCEVPVEEHLVHRLDDGVKAGVLAVDVEPGVRLARCRYAQATTAAIRGTTTVD
jgi:hypothetical protein